MIFPKISAYIDKNCGGEKLNIILKQRAISLARHIIQTNQTVRQTADVYGISKSTVHKDVTQILKYTNKTLYYEVKKILETNKRERHLRGGEATKQKYQNLNMNKTGSRALIRSDIPKK